MSEYEICADCGFGHYHDYNGVVMCASCGQPKSKPEDVPLVDRLPQRPVRTTTTRKRRTTDE